MDEIMEIHPIMCPEPGNDTEDICDENAITYTTHNLQGTKKKHDGLKKNVVVTVVMQTVNEFFSEMNISFLFISFVIHFQAHFWSVHI